MPTSFIIFERLFLSLLIIIEYVTEIVNVASDSGKHGES